MADDKTTKMPKQSATDTGPGKGPRPGRRKRLLPRKPKKDGTAGSEPAGVRL